LPEDPKETKLKPLKTEIVYGDLVDYESLLKAVYDTEAVVHCAALMAVPGGMSERQFFDINVKGTFNLLEAVRQKTPKTKRVVYISSTSAYDVYTSKDLPIKETSPLNPLSLYGLTKVLNEEIVFNYVFQYDIPVTALLPNYIMACDEVLGPWTAGLVLGVLKSSALNPKCSFYVPGIEKPWEPLEKVMKDPSELCIPRGLDGTPWRWHCTDVRDVVQGAILALEKEQAIGEVFNICGPAATCWEETVKYLAEKTGRTYIECYLPNLWQFEFDNSKAERLLGYQPQYDIRKMVDSALEYRQGKDIGVIPA